MIKTDYVPNGQAIIKPADPYSVGYTFNAWSPIVPQNAMRTAMYIAEYSLEDKEYVVSVQGAASEGGAYKYNTLVTLAADLSAIPEGEQFAYWTRNGKIVSYNTQYSFYVWDETSVAAVSKPGASALAKLPSVIMDTPKIIGDRMICMSERTLPSDYELIESGILFSKVSADLEIGNATVDKAVAQSKQKNGQFTARKDSIQTGETYYARAYLIYKAPGGNYEVIYSNTVSN